MKSTPTPNRINAFRDSALPFIHPPPRPPDNAFGKTGGVDVQGMADDRALLRIIATLVALADLALHVGELPWPLRCLVLFFMRRGDAVARDFVGGAALAPQTALPASPGSRAEAVGLAKSFLALAAALSRLLRLAFRLRLAAHPDSLARSANPPRAAFAPGARCAYDTS